VLRKTVAHVSSGFVQRNGLRPFLGAGSPTR
jgi:hypothetical protein